MEEWVVIGAENVARAVMIIRMIALVFASYCSVTNLALPENHHIEGQRSQ